jgi:hypothetical protein
MPKKKYYKQLFLIGAIWNWSAAAVFALGYKILFPLFGMGLPLYPAFFQMFLGLAFVFGIGYFWVSKDLDRNHDIVRMGIIGKFFVFTAMLWAWISGQIPLILTGAGVVDLVFAVLYIEFLLTYKKTETMQ